MTAFRTKVMLATAFSTFALSACGFNPRPIAGKQACGPAGASRQCPDGYYCASDSTCWPNGQSPGGTEDGGGNADGSGRDGPAGADGGMVFLPDSGMGGGGDVRLTPPPDAFVPHDALPAPSSRALVTAGVKASSASYYLIGTAGQSPGGNNVRTSASYRAISGVVASTQRSE